MWLSAVELKVKGCHEMNGAMESQRGVQAKGTRNRRAIGSEIKMLVAERREWGRSPETSRQCQGGKTPGPVLRATPVPELCRSSPHAAAFCSFSSPPKWAPFYAIQEVKALFLPWATGAHGRVRTTARGCRCHKGKALPRSHGSPEGESGCAGEMCVHGCV